MIGSQGMRSDAPTCDAAASEVTLKEANGCGSVLVRKTATQAASGVFLLRKTALRECVPP